MFCHSVALLQHKVICSMKHDIILSKVFFHFFFTVFSFIYYWLVCMSLLRQQMGFNYQSFAYTDSSCCLQSDDGSKSVPEELSNVILEIQTALRCYHSPVTMVHSQHWPQTCSSDMLPYIQPKHQQIHVYVHLPITKQAALMLLVWGIWTDRQTDVQTDYITHQ